MASRLFKQPLGSLEVDTVELFATWTVGAAGAVDTSSAKGLTVTNTGTGEYTLTLQDAYNRLLDCSATLLDATASNPATVGVAFQCKSEDVSSSTPDLVIRASTLDDGAAADPREGARVLVRLVLRNSSVTY